MTRDDIIRMAREAELYEDGKYFVCEHSELVRFAALVAEREREECAKLCDETEQPNLYGVRECAAAIRARGETK